MLAIQVGVSKNQLLIFDRLRVVRDLSPALGFRAQTTFEKFVFVYLELLQESGTHLEILPSRIEKLKSFDHAPPVPSHNESCNDKASSILCLLTFNKHTFVIFQSLVHKIKNLVRYLLSLVEQDLLLIILPIQSQVLHSYAVPVVGQLHARSIHNSLNLV